MRLLLQRVTRADVSVDDRSVGSIDRGYLLFVCVMKGDERAQAEQLAEKIVKLRLFEGDDGTINVRSLLDIGGSALVVSQFTLAGETKKGNRPDYTAAASPEEAEKLYRYFVACLQSRGVKRVETGVFGAAMHVSLLNDGPVTLWMER